MADKRIITICQSGGEFQIDTDGSLSYRGGDAHAIDIDARMQFNVFKMEIAEMFSYSINGMSIKYFLPGNRKTLITISNDKDLQRMIKFHNHCDTVYVYAFMGETVVPDMSNMPGSRSSRTTLSEALGPVDAPFAAVDSMVEDIMGDTSPVDLSLVDHIQSVEDASVIDPQLTLPSDMPYLLNFADPNDPKHAKVAQQWQNTITGVGQRFSSVSEFREALRKYSIAHQFAFKYKKNDKFRVTVKCKAEGCPWRIHASRLSTTRLICIKKMNSTHTCEGASSTTGHQATRSWVASIIKEKLKFSPNYKPKDIVNDIKMEYGIQLNYFQAWRGKEIAKEQLQGSYKEAYNQLPTFCERIMEANPGSFAAFTTKDDSSFHRLFVSFHASLFGFQHGCRPLLFLDSLPLKSKYQGTLLVATAADGNDGVFPVSFAVVDRDDNDNWHWFLLELKSALSTSAPLTFVADRQGGLKESIETVFPDSFHAYCLQYLTEQLMKEVKGPLSHEVKRLIVEDIYSAASASKPEIFHRSLESMKSISSGAYNWIIQSDPVNWANAFFQGARYNHMTSNFGGLFYSWVSDAHELPITQMVDVIRDKITELIYIRRADSNQWLSRLTPSMEDRLEKESLKARGLHFLHSVGNTFEVRGDSVEIVDLDNWDCSCKGWQLTGLPCCHAIFVLGYIGRSPYDYCSRYFTTDSYKITYSGTVQPVPSEELPLLKDSSQATVTIIRPPTRRPPGRPATKKSSSKNIAKRQLQCSKCKGSGHNKSTCKELPQESDLPDGYGLADKLVGSK